MLGSLMSRKSTTVQNDWICGCQGVSNRPARTSSASSAIRALGATDSTTRYGTALRAWLEAHHGTPASQRTGYDTGTSRRLPAGARQLESLRR